MNFSSGSTHGSARRVPSDSGPVKGSSIEDAIKYCLVGTVLNHCRPKNAFSVRGKSQLAVGMLFGGQNIGPEFRRLLSGRRQAEEFLYPGLRLQTADPDGHEGNETRDDVPYFHPRLHERPPGENDSLRAYDQDLEVSRLNAIRPLWTTSIRLSLRTFMSASGSPPTTMMSAIFPGWTVPNSVSRPQT